MTMVSRAPAHWISDQDARTRTVGRDSVIDTTRGIAILMVIAIHSLPQPLDASWQKLIDAALRPCVPIFLFASGYLTALSGKVALWKRVKAALIPYAIAFFAAYIYMALHNAAMDHRVTTTAARFIFAYVFVYYYVFVYIGCTLGLWLIFQIAERNTFDGRQRLVVLLSLSIVVGLIAGSYIDPLLARVGISDSVVQEVRLRDIPFWFSFVALGALVGLFTSGSELRNMRLILAASALAAYFIYAAVRIFGIGDAADYDSTAFFGYASLLCVLLLVVRPRLPLLATIGSGSYFIYLWHIFPVMALRDHTSLRALGPIADFAATYTITAVVSVGALLAVRRIAPSCFSRWLGA
jgi:surface polysaccharide O-acyltransferase-like enzyme